MELENSSQVQAGAWPVTVESRSDVGHGSLVLNLNYRGHEIRITQTEDWSVELVELETGVLLPTKLTAPGIEELIVCVERARCLVDLYLEGQRRRAN